MKRAAALALALASACGARDPKDVPDSNACDPVATFEFAPDVPLGEEAYLCFAFDAAAVVNAPRGFARIEAWSRADSPVVLHHTSLYAVPGPFPDRSADCRAMPAGAVPLDVWTRGGAPLALPDGYAFALPPSTARIVVQAHVLRAAPGPPPAASITLCAPQQSAPARVAWMRATAPVPAIRPHTTETSTGVCRVATSVSTLFAWPHMHRAGRRFHGLVDVDPWDFEHQRVYPVARALAAGDPVETTCVWRNDGDAYVLPGAGVDDEMCGQALVVWPAEGARCDP